MKARIPRELAIPCHEGSHAVVCLALGSSFECIRLRDEVREIPAWAQMMGATRVTSRGQFVPTDERVDRYGALVEAKIFLAGLAFEKLRCPKKTYFELSLSTCYTDCDKAEEWCEYHVIGAPRSDAKLCDDDRLEVSRTYALALQETRRLVCGRWDDIFLVGKALAERRELSQCHVELILSSKLTA
jgi:hypothetical protein